MKDNGGFSMHLHDLCPFVGSSRGFPGGAKPRNDRTVMNSSYENSDNLLLCYCFFFFYVIILNDFR